MSFYKRIKWLIKEFGLLYSNKDSFFSKKRIESGFAFIAGTVLLFMPLTGKIQMIDACMGAGTLYTIAGYNVKKIQEEKENDNDCNQNKDLLK